MRIKLPIAVLACLLPALLAPAVSRGAEFDIRPAVCPVSGHDFFGLTIRAVNTLKHRDGDFLLRAEGGNQYATWIWSCPYCFFSARPEVFSGDVAVEFDSSSIEKADLTDAARESEKVQLHIPPDIKYRNAVSYYYAVGTPPYDLGVLNLQGSWSARMEKVSLPPGYLGTWWNSYMKVSENDDRRSEEEVYLAIAGDLESKLRVSNDEDEKLKLKYLLASTLRQAGEHFRAKPILREVLEASNSRELSAAAQRELQLASSEAAFQKEAVRYFKEALQFKETLPEDRLQSIYLVGELSRRLGDYESARTWYDRSAENPMPQRWARQILSRQRKILERTEAGR